MSEIHDHSRISRGLQFIAACFFVGFIVICLVTFARKEFDEFAFWKTVWVFGLLAGIIDTWLRWEQCRKNPASQLLQVALMTIGPSIIAIVVQIFLGWCCSLIIGNFQHLAK